MNKGSYEGTIDEIKFVAQFNSNKTDFRNYLSCFDQYANLWMVRVTTMQMSQLSRRKVYTRSDCYLANIDTDITNLLEKYNYYLDESILDEEKIKYTKVPFSGISVKMTSSKNFQILKTYPNSFYALFNSYELGAGASLFCKRESELEKNLDLIRGWESSLGRMNAYFNTFTKDNMKFYLDQDICKAIKSYACDEIKRQIENSDILQKKIFNGVDLYEEPYTAFYFYHGTNITELNTIPFKVTTGSGRSKGDYTIVLKPL